MSFFFLYFFAGHIGKSCSEIKYHSPQTQDGSYTIDPDGEGGFEPFTVFCDMTDKNGQSSVTTVKPEYM